MAIETILLDLDGVIRHFDPDRPAEVERRHSIAAGSLLAAAFAPERITPLVTGRMTRAQWTERIGQAVGSIDAASDWLSHPAEVDAEVIAIVDRFRADGYPVSILTNGTDTVPAELEQAGILDRFDDLFNTADIGVAKPDPAIFEHVCRSLGSAPETVFFTDDSAGNVDGARRCGLTARLFRNADGLAADLDEVVAP